MLLEKSGGAYLQSLRINAQRSLREVGNSVEPPIHSAHLSQIERGNLPRLNLLPRLCQAYGVSLLELLDAYGLAVPTDDLEAARAFNIGQQVLSLDTRGQESVLSFVSFLQHKEQAETSEQV